MSDYVISEWDWLHGSATEGEMGSQFWDLSEHAQKRNLNVETLK